MSGEGIALAYDDVTFRYPGSRGDVLSGVSMAFPAGAFALLVGGTGSGKSTLVRMLCALTAPTAGSIEVAGVPVASTGKRGRNVRPKSANRKQLAQLRRHVGYVMQHPEHQLFADTVAEDVAYGPRNQGLGETEVADRVRESLELLHIGHLADRSPFDLSGGQQRLAAIAGVLAMEPECIVLDEATAMLDPVGRREVLSAVHRLNREKGITVVLITHHMNEAEDADRVVVMDDGKVIMDGAPRQVFTQVERLRSMGLTVPDTVDLLDRLRKDGLDVPLTALTVEECADAILAAVSK